MEVWKLCTRGAFSHTLRFLLVIPKRSRYLAKRKKKYVSKYVLVAGNIEGIRWFIGFSRTWENNGSRKRMRKRENEKGRFGDYRPRSRLVYGGADVHQMFKKTCCFKYHLVKKKTTLFCRWLKIYPRILSQRFIKKKNNFGNKRKGVSVFLDVKISADFFPENISL